MYGSCKHSGGMPGCLNACASATEVVTGACCKGTNARVVPAAAWCARESGCGCLAASTAPTATGGAVELAAWLLLVTSNPDGASTPAACCVCASSRFSRACPNSSCSSMVLLGQSPSKSLREGSLATAKASASRATRRRILTFAPVPMADMPRAGPSIAVTFIAIPMLQVSRFQSVILSSLQAEVSHSSAEQSRLEACGNSESNLPPSHLKHKSSWPVPLSGIHVTHAATSSPPTLAVGGELLCAGGGGGGGGKCECQLCEG